MCERAELATRTTEAAANVAVAGDVNEAEVVARPARVVEGEEEGGAGGGNGGAGTAEGETEEEEEGRRGSPRSR